MHDLLPLHLLQPGQLAVVAQLLGQREHVQRLEELGLRAGAAVEVVQPGSPCLLRVGASVLAIRDGDAFSVLVRVEVAV